MLKNKKALLVIILYIVLIYWIWSGCLSTLGIHIFFNKHMVDNYDVDGTDFSPFVNFGIFVVGGAVSFFAKVGMYLITAVGSLILAVLCRIFLLKKDDTQGKTIRNLMKVIFIVTVFAYIAACIISRLYSTFFMFITLAWIPFLFFLINYLPLKDNNNDIVEFIEPNHNFGADKND